LLRRLLVVGLAGALLALPAAARAATAAIFYYPWYGTPALDGGWQHWNQNGHTPPTNLYSRFYPALGPYSSGDPRVVGRQLAEIKAAGIDEIVVSWWGRGSTEDRRLPLILALARRQSVLVAVHLEPYPGRSPASVEQDLAYIASLGVHDVYVYHPLDFSAADWASVTHAAPSTLRLLAGTDLVGFAAAAGFAGVYTYDFSTYNGGKFGRICAQAHAAHLICAPSVGPGYDGRRAGEPPGGRARANGATYDRLWAAALAASPDIVSITSFNEWGEGTQIEPAQARSGYASYDGAYGFFGPAAQMAYLTRTSYWTERLHAQH
jgi:hypothetical protein